jgi:hypothetical protein
VRPENAIDDDARGSRGSLREADAAGAPDATGDGRASGVGRVDADGMSHAMGEPQKSLSDLSEEESGAEACTQAA